MDIQNSTSAIEAFSINKPVFRTGNYDSPFDGYDLIPPIKKLEEYIENSNYEKIFVNYRKMCSLKINNYIGFNDGLNHLRFVLEILNYLENNENNKSLKISFNVFFIIKKTIIFTCLNYFLN